MSQIPHPGSKDLLFHRMLKAVISSVIVQFLLMSFLILITHLSPTKPLSWLEETLSLITSLRTFCYFLILATVIILQGVVCSKSYLTAPNFAETRFSLVCSLFTLQNLIVAAIHLIIGIILVSLHLSFENGKYSCLKKACATIPGNCLVEENSLLLTAGLFTGIYYFVKNNFFAVRYLKFPIIPQTKFTQVGREISRLVPTAMTTAIWPTMYFLVIYYTLGGYLRGIITSIFFLNTEDEEMDKISRLINTNLIFHIWLYSALFSLTMNSMHLLFQVHLTEWMEFDIGTSVYTNQCSMSLSEALAMDQVPIIQHLGYWDLVTLSQKQKTRRRMIFSLSQPGGHPYNWNCLVEKCLGLIRGFSKRIEEICSVKPEVTVPVKNLAQNLERPYAFHMRNLAAKVNEVAEAGDVGSSKPGGSTGQVILELVKKKRESILSYLMSKPVVFFFFGMRSESKIQHLLIEGQPVIWAVEAISSLAVISLKEDPYGIVQKDLPGMIEGLLGLKQALDKLQKMSLLMRKPQQDDREMRHLLGALRSANRRSIYRIVMGFREYVDDLTLEGGIKEQLQGFFSCRE